MMRLEIGDQVNLTLLKELLRQPLLLESKDVAVVVNPEHVKFIKHNKRFSLFVIVLTDDSTITIHYNNEMKIEKIDVDYG
jgi:hypothetical protein